MMDKNKGDNRHGMAAVEGNTVKEAPKSTDTLEVPVPTANHTLTYRRDHPQNRCSYGVAGNPGIVVFDLALFAGLQAPVTITVDCALVQPKTVSVSAKAEAAAARLVEKAAKAQQKLDAQQAKAAERQAKADAALAAAKARVEAAAAAKAKETTQA